MGEFADKVFDQVRRIPRGKVSTYGQIARLIGSPRSARFVGYALRANPAPGTDPADIPCHRVVFKDGAMAPGFAFGGPDVQRQMLMEEGVMFADADHVDMDACLWDGHAPIPADSCSNVNGEGMVPLGPPPDFDWKREMGEDTL